MLIEWLVKRYILRSMAHPERRAFIFRAIHEGWRKCWAEDNDITRHADSVYWFTTHNPYAHPQPFLGQRTVPHVENFAAASHDAVIAACKLDRLPHYRNGLPWREFDLRIMDAKDGMGHLYR